MNRKGLRVGAKVEGLGSQVLKVASCRCLSWKFVVLFATTVNITIFIFGQYRQSLNLECHFAAPCVQSSVEQPTIIQPPKTEIVDLKGALAILKDTAGNVSSMDATVKALVKDLSERIDSENSERNDAVDPQKGPLLVHEVEEECMEEYSRVTAKRTDGLTDEDVQRAWMYRGNRYRLTKFVEKLRKREEPVTAVVSGGSISLGHGVQVWTRYSNRLEKWMNQNYRPKKPRYKHRVLNRGAHGADICVMAKRVNLIIDELRNQKVIPDLYVLEFAVNDYQGQDEILFLDYKFNTFFEGFERIAMCTEAVVRKLLIHFPDLAVMFLEMRTSIMARKTASLLHLGAAQHYKFPLVSYDEAMFNDYQVLLDKLKPFNYSVAINDTVLPYPHGCHPCVKKHVVPFFQKDACRSVCFMQRAGPGGYTLPCDDLAPGREKCMVPFFAHDNVHPSGVGHQIASDLIIETIAATAKDVCQRGMAGGKTNRTKDLSVPFPVPSSGWMTANPALLDLYTEFIYVNDTYEMFANTRYLEPATHSEGFSYFVDPFYRNGWMATNSTSESISFHIDLPQKASGTGNTGCYIPYLAVLKSYEGVGTFNVTMVDHTTHHVTTVDVDTLWAPRISIPVDIPIADDMANPVACTGNCSLTLTTHPEVLGRGGNKVKIVTLSVRRCMDSDVNRHKDAGKNPLLVYGEKIGG